MRKLWHATVTTWPVCRASIGEIDTDLDNTIDFGRIRAAPIQAM